MAVGYGAVWTQSAGLDLPFGNTKLAALSADRSVRVGSSYYNGSLSGAVYAAPGFVANPFGEFGGFSAVSADGMIAVGSDSVGAVRFSPSTGATLLGPLQGTSVATAAAMGISADGSIIVGRADDGQVFLWTAASGARPLASSPYFGSPDALSADGSTIVGQRYVDGQYRAYFWRAPGGERLLPLLDGTNSSAAYGVSADGSVIVGEAFLSPNFTSQTAYYWDRVRGRRDLKQFLLSLGATQVSGWTLLRATGISSDGAFIVGDGTDPQGRAQAWRAHIPPFCYANCDASSASPSLNIQDFTCFLNRFAAADPYANCDNSTAPPVLNVLDFICFLNKFAAGCP